MERENWCRLVKLIIFSVIINSGVLSAQFLNLVAPGTVTAGKLFKLEAITANPTLFAPYNLYPIRSYDGGATWVFDTKGTLAPPGGQLQAGTDTLLIAYDYKPSVIVPRWDTVGIVGWYTIGGVNIIDSTSFLVKNPIGTGDDLIKITTNGGIKQCNPIKPADWPVDFTIFPVPSRANPNIKVNIFDSFGYLVRDLSSPDDMTGEELGTDSLSLTVRWDGKNGKGFKVANGAYQFCVQMTQKEVVVWKKKFAVVR